MGWKIFELLRIPTPTILGPIAAVCAGNLLGLPVMLPHWAQPMISLAMGTMIGLRFNLKLKGLLKEVCLVVGWIVVLSLLAAGALQSAGLDRFTAIFSSVPGGLSEVALMAISLDADILVVTLLQSSRLLSTMFLIPIIAAKLPHPNEAPLYKKSEGHRHMGIHAWLIVAALVLSSALLLDYIGVPAAMIMGPMLAVGVFTQLKGYSAKIPSQVQKAVQIAIGGVVGLGITSESLRTVGSVLLPLLYLNLIIVGGSLLLAFTLHKISKWDMVTCLTCASPAGLSPTVMIAMEYGADTGKVALFQMLRLFTALLFVSVYSLLAL